MPDEATTTEAATEDVQGATTPQDTETLGDPGKKALQAEREARKTAERELRDLRARIEAMEDAQNRTAEERAALEQQRAIEREALSKANDRILAAELRAAAKGVLADPGDALTFIDRTQFEVTDDGRVDTDAITDAVKDLISKKPYLAARSEPPAVGSADGGPREASRPRQWTSDQLRKARLSGDLDSIAAARADGLLNDVLAGKA